MDFTTHSAPKYTHCCECGYMASLAAHPRREGGNRGDLNLGSYLWISRRVRSPLDQPRPLDTSIICTNVPLHWCKLRYFLYPGGPVLRSCGYIAFNTSPIGQLYQKETPIPVGILACNMPKCQLVRSGPGLSAEVKDEVAAALHCSFIRVIVSLNHRFGRYCTYCILR